MRSGLAVLALLCACGFEHGSLGGNTTSDGGMDADAPIDAPFVAPFSPGFLYRKPITITPPALSGPLADFPVGILEDADAELGDNARSDGLDIIFTSADGTMRLDHELVSFNGTTGALEAWVHIPSLPNGATTIYMYYGAAAQTASTPGAVWSSAFAGVWHLETGNDSTVHGHNAATISGASTQPGTARGIAGQARSFDGGDTLSFSSPSDGSFDPGTGSLSVSLWVNVVTSGNAFDVAMHKGGLNNTDGGYAFFLGTGNWSVHMADGTSARDVVLGTDVHNQWIQLVGVIDRDSAQLLGYRDGVASSPTGLGTLGSVDEGAGLFIGGGNTTQPFTGRIDEVRVMSGVRSPDWIATEHANLAVPTFTSFGMQEMKP